MNAIRKQLGAILALTGAGIATGVTPALAIGLGEVRVHSHLNAPLAASVTVAGPTRGIVDNRCIGVAPPPRGDRSAAGLVYLRRAQLNVVEHQGGAVLEITTREPVVEPIVNLVLRVDCPGTGRLLREYTLLLDPPLPETLQPAYARAPSGSPRTGARTARGDGALRGDIALRGDAAVDVWQVRRGETLSKIAANILPGDDRQARYRLIEEIVAHNPDVFPDGDPDRLPAGARLRIPAVTDRALARGSAAAPAPEQADRPARDDATPRVPSQGTSAHRLTLSANAQTATPQRAAETARIVGDTRELILQTEQQYANAEALKARLQRLEKQILLLERTLSSLDRVTDQVAAAGAGLKPAKSRSAAAPKSENGQSPAVAMVMPESVKKPTTPVQVDPPAPVAATATTRGGGRTDYLWWVLALFVIGSAVLWLRGRRREEEANEPLAPVEPEPDGQLPESDFAAAGDEMGARKPDLAHREVVFCDDPLAALPEETGSGETATEADTDLSGEVSAPDRGPTQQTDHGLVLENIGPGERGVDPGREVNNTLVRAEFHLLLKQSESAIQLLKGGIENSDTLREEPALWLMLLRIYRQAGQAESFAALSREFGGLFNIALPTWEEGTTTGEGEVSTLEQDFPRLLHRIVALWSTPECASFLDSLLLDDRDGTRRGFDLDVAEELLLLKGLLQLRSRP